MRKFYIKLRRAIINFVKSTYRSFAVVLTVFLFCYLVNNLIYGQLLWQGANKLQNVGECQDALNMFNALDNYYKLIRFLPINEERYMQIPIKKAFCYLDMKQTDKAETQIKQGMYRVVDKYGMNSYEYLQYLLQNVVDFYIEQNNYKAAYEYLKLSEYLSNKIKTDGREYAYINCWYGDLYSNLNNMTLANSYFGTAYSMIPRYPTLNVDIVIMINHRLGKLYINQKQPTYAIKLYSKLIDNLQKDKNVSKEQVAVSKWLLAQAYAANNNHDMAISYYDEAYDVILKLPSDAKAAKYIDALRSDMVKSYYQIGRLGMAEKLQKQIRINNRVL